jgi:predicted esterase
MNQQPQDALGAGTRAAGEPLEAARAAMVLLHGRGASAADILTLVPELDEGGFAYLAPQAEGGSWYPFSFLAPLDQNEPYLTWSLETIGALLAQIGQHIPPERTILLGFSQGACLALEFAARHARRYGGVVGLSGGLFGPDGTPRPYSGSLGGTPVFLGCSDVDPRIPAARVRESAEVLGRLGGAVTTRLYPGMGHTINQDEIAAVRAMMRAVTGSG